VLAPVESELGDSVILSSIHSVRRSEFLLYVASWLPDARFSLLYRGSRDGMTPNDFHRLCDDKGKTLVLVRVGSCVFGGYADRHWDKSSYGVKAPGSFVFIVVNSKGDPITRCNVVRPNKTCMYCKPTCGPAFYDGGFKLEATSESAVFDRKSTCDFGGDLAFGDPLGHGLYTLCGSYQFTPDEVEVYQVTGGKGPSSVAVVQ
jgi:hypothetical protein